ncbi:MAG TPA: SPFH domain-containing protein [Candidatus Limnocylindria bacterium]|nr:SPFH domain-containing protein [Candidatus Limnocylindria bacterium]
MMFYSSEMFGFLIFFGFCCLGLIVLLAKSFLVVRQAEAVIIERFGKYDRTLLPGIHMVVPFLERPRTVIWNYVQEIDGGKRYHRYMRSFNRIDVRESVYDFPRQSVITKDNVTMEINALIYYQITNPKAAVYEVLNLTEAIEKLAQTTLRNIIGSMDLDETLVSRDSINEKLRIILDDATDKWGVKVNRVELQEVTPPADIRHAMEKQMRAERDRRAIILEAEGTKSAAILEAEGMQESQVLRARGEADSRIINAEGEAQSRLKIAEAEAKAIEMIRGAAGGDPMPYLIALKYIQALPEMTKGKDDKLVLIPYEATSLVGSLATIKKVFEEVK